ncbi:MAG: hypothetical protein QOD64_197 [Verrucomicrobiota bacterium]
MTNNRSAPPVPATKRSMLLWMFGGCAFLLIVGIVVAVVFFRSVSNLTLMNNKVVSPKTSNSPVSNSESQPRSAPATAPAGWVTYVNKPDDHPKLRTEFVAFSISYPPEFTKKAAPDAFLDLQKVGASKDDMLQEVSVNPVSFSAPPESEYDPGLDKIAGFLRQVFSNLQMGAKEPVTMDGASGRAARFQGLVKGAKYRGRAILVCPTGLVRGLFFLTVEKESEAGTTAEILQQFRW